MSVLFAAMHNNIGSKGGRSDLVVRVCLSRNGEEVLYNTPLCAASSAPNQIKHIQVNVTIITTPGNR